MYEIVGNNEDDRKSENDETFSSIFRHKPIQLPTSTIVIIKSAFFMI